MHKRAFRIFLLGLLFTGRCLAVYLGMDRAALVQELGPPVSRAAMGAHEILLYPNDVRIELQDGKVVDVEGMSYRTKPPAISPVQNAPATVAETPKVETPAPGEVDTATQAEAPATENERAKMEDAVMQMEKTHDEPQETPSQGKVAMKLLVEFFLRWVVMVFALKLTCIFWGVTVEWPGLMLAALADAVTRMTLHLAAIYFLHLPSFFFVENGVAAVVLVIVLMKVSINRGVKQAVQLTLTSKTFALVVWAVVITVMLRSSFG
jgi:hypothetical protein